MPVSAQQFSLLTAWDLKILENIWIEVFSAIALGIVFGQLLCD